MCLIYLNSLIIQILVIMTIFLKVVCSANKPNIILIVTDDQDIILNGMTPLSKTINLLANNGVIFPNAFTSSPTCCPSRSSILTGSYAHNHRTINNTVDGGCYSQHWQDKFERSKTLPVYLHNHGYETYFSGKYLNRYFSKNIPHGWDHWYGLHGNSKYYNYTLNVNGNLVEYTDEYLTDVIKNFTLEFLSNRSTNNKPFFVMITPPAAHAPFTPAERHEHAFEGIQALRTPNFNVPVTNQLGKHWLLRMISTPLSDDIIKNVDNYYRKRWQTLLAVDELVAEMMDELEKLHLNDNTYIIFTSDNGYHLGQFAQPFDKRQPYETDIRVPFIVKGPNITAKSINYSPVVLIDILPTILDLAGIEKPDNLDGISLHNQLEKDYQIDQWILENYERQILIEYWGEGNQNTYNPQCPWSKNDYLTQCTLDAGCHCQDSWNNTYSCVRHIANDLDKIYCEFKDNDQFVEAYDLKIDRFQLENIGFDMLPSEHAIYSIRLNNLKKCQGDLCKKIY